MKEAKGTVVLEERRAPLVARILGIAVVLVMGGVLVVWGVDLGRRIVGASHGQNLPDLQQQLDDAQAEIARLTAERDALQGALKAAGVALPAPGGASQGAAGGAAAGADHGAANGADNGAAGGATVSAAGGVVSGAAGDAVNGAVSGAASGAVHGAAGGALDRAAIGAGAGTASARVAPAAGRAASGTITALPPK